MTESFRSQTILRVGHFLSFELKLKNLEYYRVPPNVYFVAACNPYQIKKIGSNTVNDIVFTHPSKQNLLSHRVLPISPSLLSKIHDYGSLSKEVETKYIQSMISTVFPYTRDGEVKAKKSYAMKRYLEILVDVTSFCQSHVKALNNNASSLSLRDVHRVKEVFLFYLALMAYKKHFETSNEKFDEFRRRFAIDHSTINNVSFLTALVVTIALNYVNRISSANKKKNLKRLVIEKISSKLFLKRKLQVFDGILLNQFNMLVRRLRRLQKLPKDIAVNTPLKENLLAIFVAVYSQTPLFICGKPGSSKSVSVHIVKKSFDGQVLGDKDNFLDGMRPLRFEYYQGSDQSTDKGVEKVFLRALFHQSRGKKQSVVFIDEIGLAELSPNNPLKVLHKFLDTTSHSAKSGESFTDPKDTVQTGEEKLIETQQNYGKVSFVGISNWDIDASKQNRNLYVARPDPDQSDLQSTAQSILQKAVPKYGNMAYQEKRTLKTILETLSKAYIEFRKIQSKQFRHKNFHTLRDFYWTVKVLGRLCANRSAGVSLFAMVARAIDINFAGIYSSALTQEQRDKNLRTKALGKRIKNCNLQLQSNYIFKKVFWEKLSGTTLQKNISSVGFFQADSDVLAHVDRALSSDAGRYLLLFVDRALTTELLLSKLKR